MLEGMRKSGGRSFLDPNCYGALTLAYLGDCVYEMQVRSFLLSQGDHKVKDLHKKATHLVCAKAQAEFYHRIAPLLSEEEQAAFHRGRNTKSQVPKNAHLSDYRTATGVETLLGHLYIEGKTERIDFLMQYLFSESNQGK